MGFFASQLQRVARDAAAELGSLQTDNGMGLPAFFVDAAQGLLRSFESSPLDFVLDRLGLQRKQNTVATNMAAFAAGAVFGGATVWLIAPESGEDLRMSIQTRFNELMGRGRELGKLLGARMGMGEHEIEFEPERATAARRVTMRESRGTARSPAARATKRGRASKAASQRRAQA